MDITLPQIFFVEVLLNGTITAQPMSTNTQKIDPEKGRCNLQQ
jgi:hypothetical protein